MFRRLLLAILVIALPLQGVASTAMTHCGPSRHVAFDAHYDHAADHHGSNADADQDHHPHYSSGDASHHGNDSNHSGHGDKSDCCASTVAIATSLAGTFPPAGPPVASLYVAGALPSVFLEGLRRPPRTLLA
jgi:hypothetical protein